MDKGKQFWGTRLALPLIVSAAFGIGASEEVACDLPNPFIPVEIHKESTSAKWRHPFHDIRTTWDKYFQVYEEELEGFESVPFRKVVDDPAYYLDRKIQFDLYFAKIGQFYRPFISPFIEDTYVNFSAWPYGADLWTKDGRGTVHPLFYIDKKRKKLADKISSLPMFAPIHVWAEVKSKSDRTPWFEIKGLETIPEPFLDMSSLRHIELGYTQVSKKRYDLAVAAFENALKLQLPAHVEADVYAMLGKAYTELRAYSQARNALVNGVLRDRSNVTNLILLARADLKLDRADEARQAAEAALVIEPSNALAHAELGLAIAILGDVRAGYKEEDFAQKLARNQLPEANRNRAMIALREGKLNIARDELNQAVILRPTDVDLKLELGDVYTALNDAESARREYTQARDLAQHRPEPYYKLAIMLKNQADALKKDGKEAEAKKLYEEALENAKNAILRDDQFAPGYGLQAEILRALGRTDDAKKVLENGAKIRGNQSRMWPYLYDHAVATGDFQMMEQATRALLEQKPSAMLYRHLGDALANKPEPDMAGAADAYAHAVEMAPEDEHSLSMLGHIRAVYLNDPTGAESVLQKAVKLDPKNALAWRDLATALRHTGSLNDALSAAEESVKLEPTISARLLVAHLKLEQGDAEAALDLAKKAETDAQGDMEKAWASAIQAGALTKLGKTEDAVALFGKADALQGQSAEYNLWYGLALQQSGVISGAEEHLRSAIRISQSSLATSKVSQRVNVEATQALKSLGATAKAKTKPESKPIVQDEKAQPEKNGNGKSATKRSAPVIEEPEKSQPVPVEVPGPR